MVFDGNVGRTKLGHSLTNMAEPQPMAALPLVLRALLSHLVPFNGVSLSSCRESPKCPLSEDLSSVPGELHLVAQKTGITDHGLSNCLRSSGVPIPDFMGGEGSPPSPHMVS